MFITHSLQSCVARSHYVAKYLSKVSYILSSTISSFCKLPKNDGYVTFLQFNKCMSRIRTHFVSGILPTGNTAQAITISKFRTDIENVITGVKCSLKHQGYILFFEKKMLKYYSSKATDTKKCGELNFKIHFKTGCTRKPS